MNLITINHFLLYNRYDIYHSVLLFGNDLCQITRTQTCVLMCMFLDLILNFMAMSRAKVHEEFWIHKEWLVHQGHHQALEHR